MRNLFENIEDYKQFFDEMQEGLKKGLIRLFGEVRKYMGR